MIETEATTNPVARTKLGDTELWAVEEIAHKKPLSAMTTDEALVRSLPAWMFPTYIDAGGALSHEAATMGSPLNG